LIQCDFLEHRVKRVGRFLDPDYLSAHHTLA
jgi:hypothetical protein